MSKLIKNNQCHCTVMPGCDEPVEPDYACRECSGTGIITKKLSLIERLMKSYDCNEEQACLNSKESL